MFSITFPPACEIHTDNFYLIFALIGLLKDISVAATGLNLSVPLFPLWGTWTGDASIHQFPLPIPPFLLLSMNFALIPPLLLGPPSSKLSGTSHEADFPPPLALFPVSSTHEEFFLKCAVPI